MSQATVDMNCTDYKEALTAEPGYTDESGHLTSCADCQSYREEILSLNEKLIAAMEIAVPELVMPELADIASENVVSLSSRRETPKAVWFAMAASVVLAVFVGFRMTGTGVTQIAPSYGTLEEQVLAHVDHEPKALQPSATPVSDTQLSHAVPESVAAMNHDAGLITFAASCSINGNDVPHLVIQGARGPITILLMPQESIEEATSIEGINIKGIILPVGSGSIAIIGDREEQLDQVKKNVLDSVMWST
jgi:hypothetical protein